MIATPAFSRRDALKGAAGLVVAVHLPGRAFAQAGNTPAPLAPNAFVRIGEDDSVTVVVRFLEFGQGPLTGIATLVAEELDADWAQVRAEHAPANSALFANPLFGFQGTGGSSSVASSWNDMRRAGAVARAMLVGAAAEAWAVPEAEITIENGVLAHAGSGRSGRFGEFVAAASRRTPPDPATVALKDASQYRLIGKDDVSMRRLDGRAKSTGTAKFTIDIYEPGMLTVVLARPPRFGAKVARFDDAEARAVPGVVDVKVLPSGVAVYAEGMWAAMQGRRKLRVEWDETGVERRGTPELLSEFRALAQTAGLPVSAHGDVAAALADADQVVEAVYEFPYLAHAPMEPINGFLSWDGARAHARYGCQAPGLDQVTIAQILGIAPDLVTLDIELAGGSFGRRGQFANPFAAELAEAAKAIGPGRPVKVQWLREDDIRGGFYRPMMLHRFRGAVKAGRVTAFADTVVGQSLVVGTPFEPMFTQGGVDMGGVEGVNEIAYEIPNFSCDAHNPAIGVPALFWRSVGHSHTGFARECFLDELLSAAGLDPVEGRLSMLPADSREAGVLRAVAEMADWSGPGPADGRARGVAQATSFGTAVAQIAEVSVENSRLVVHKIWCAVDCGVAVNPDVVRAQMEGGIGYGLGHSLYSAITLRDGQVIPGNFDRYRALRISEMPEVEVRILPSTANPSGVGEPGVPPSGPAVANAMVALGLPRSRQLPIVSAV
jgi:isoquinoline 1-oxidoreductase beta subunit